jgi:hypothetical protein
MAASAPLPLADAGIAHHLDLVLRYSTLAPAPGAKPRYRARTTRKR